MNNSKNIFLQLLVGFLLIGAFFLMLKNNKKRSDSMNSTYEKNKEILKIFFNAWEEENLEIIGSGPEDQKLNQLIHELNLSDRIKISTNYDYNSIEDKYKTASGLIVSSHREGGPRVLLEAINHEIPVLGSSVGMIPDLIPAECLSEPGNQESLQALLEEMVP